MMIFSFPPILDDTNTILLWGVDKSWPHMGTWNAEDVHRELKKNLGETRFDTESTKLFPPNTNSQSSANIYSALKKTTYVLKKIHSRDITFFNLCLLNNINDELFIEGVLPSWTKLLALSPAETRATIYSPPHGVWFSIKRQATDSFHVLRSDYNECKHHLSLEEHSSPKFSALSEWLTTTSPQSISFLSRIRQHDE